MNLKLLLRMSCLSIFLSLMLLPRAFGQEATAPAQSQTLDQRKEASEEVPQTPPIGTLTENLNSDYNTLTAIRKTSAEVWLGIQVIFLAVLSLAILCILGRKADFNADFQKTFLLIVVISAASFLIVAGYTDQQLAPMFSLFGAIVGYLFGRTDASKSTSSAPAARPDPPERVT